MNKLLYQRDCVFLLLDFLNPREIVSFKRVCKKFRDVVNHYIKKYIGNIEKIPRILKIGNVKELELCFKKSNDVNICSIIEIYYKEIDIKLYVYLNKNLEVKTSFEEKNVSEKMNCLEKNKTLDMLEKAGKGSTFLSLLPHHKFCNAKFV